MTTPHVAWDAEEKRLLECGPTPRMDETIAEVWDNIPDGAKDDVSWISAEARFIERELGVVRKRLSEAQRVRDEDHAVGYREGHQRGAEYAERSREAMQAVWDGLENDDKQIVYEDTPATWAVYRDPEGYVGRGKTREAALMDYIEWMEDRLETRIGDLKAAHEGWQQEHLRQAARDADYAERMRGSLEWALALVSDWAPTQFYNMDDYRKAIAFLVPNPASGSLTEAPLPSTAQPLPADHKSDKPLDAGPSAHEPALQPGAGPDVEQLTILRKEND